MKCVLFFDLKILVDVIVCLLLKWIDLDYGFLNVIVGVVGFVFVLKLREIFDLNGEYILEYYIYVIGIENIKFFLNVIIILINWIYLRKKENDLIRCELFFL